MNISGSPSHSHQSSTGQPPQQEIQRNLRNEDPQRSMQQHYKGPTQAMDEQNETENEDEEFSLRIEDVHLGLGLTAGIRLPDKIVLPDNCDLS